MKIITYLKCLLNNGRFGWRAKIVKVSTGWLVVSYECDKNLKSHKTFKRMKDAVGHFTSLEYGRHNEKTLYAK